MPKPSAATVVPADRISLVVPCYNESQRVPLLLQGLQQFDQKWGAAYEVIVVDDGSQDDTVALLHEKLTGLKHADRMEIVELSENKGKGEALKAGVAVATGDFVLTLDADMATHPLLLQQWLKRLGSDRFDQQTIYIGSREHPDSKVDGRGRRAAGLLFNFVTQMMTSLTVRDTQCGFKLYPAAIAKSLFAGMQLKGWAHDVELLYKAQFHGITIQDMPVQWKHVDESKVNVLADGIKMVFSTIIAALRIRFDWFIGQPLRTRFAPSALSGESSGYRFAFALVAAVLLFLMPMLSYDYGITGDEYAQKVYGELIDQHFKTNGTYKMEGGTYDGQDALTMQPNLWLYGGLFDYLAAKVYTALGTDPYNTRHFLNAFVGFLLIFFTGLLAKEVSHSWKVGLLALLLTALSPRIFGHAMNNPKDIPFAAAYIFTLLHLVRFVKQLPRPGAKSVMYLILGIGASIGIRIGGLLLVGYLGLFTGLAFLFKAHLRKLLVHLPTLMRVAGIGALVIFLGYLLGIANWPYARQDWIAHPLEALGEMSNFDYGIQMLYAGKHLWSDQLPWYYIPKWILMAAPIAVLIGAALYLVWATLQRSARTFEMMLLVFALVFPIAYAIYQGSSLYDGMRHFLFVYPVFAVLAALGWGLSANAVPRKIAGYLSVGAPVLLLLLPATWMVRNHPYEYTYINPAFGGTASAEAQYETDYWMTSVKALCEWFVANVPEVKTEEKVVVMMSAHPEAARHYFEKLAPNVKVLWQRYPDRAKRDEWDYGIFFSRFQNEGHLRSGAWPPYEVLYTEEVSGVPIGAVVKKGNSQAGPANAALDAGDVQRAITLLNQEVLQNPKNEAAWLMLAEAYGRIGDYANMGRAADGALALSDTYVSALAIKGFRFYSEFEQTRSTNPQPALLDSAIVYYEKAAAANYKFSTAYYYLAFCYANKNDFNAVVQNLEQFALNNGMIPQAYDLGIQVSQQLQDQVRLKYFQARKAMTAQNYQQALQLSNEVYRMNPKYEPGVQLKAFFDDLLAKQQSQ